MRGRSICGGLAASLLLATTVSGAAAYGPVGPHVQVSNVADTSLIDAAAPAVAYSATDTEYLVVWSVYDGGENAANRDRYEVYGQRIDADGTPIGSDFRISTTGPETGPGSDDWVAVTPDVAWNPTQNRYLVVWTVNYSGPDSGLRSRIWGQYLTGTGQEQGVDFAISAATVGQHNVFLPSVTASTTADQFLVTYEEGFDVAVTLVTGGAPGTEFAVTPDGGGNAGGPAATHNPTRDEYLITWTQEINRVDLDTENEIFARRYNNAGSALGDAFRVSTAGSDGVVTRDAGGSSAAFRPEGAHGEYLVTWASNDSASGSNVFGQRISGLGAEIGGDFAVTTFPDTDVSGTPVLSYSSTAGEYFVVFSADALATRFEVEVFGRRISPTGALVGGALRLSTTDTDGNDARQALGPDVAYNAAADEYLGVWNADNGPTLNDDEIWGSRLDLGATVTLTVAESSDFSPGSGTVTSTPAGISCPPTCSAPFLSGTQVRLTQTPDTGSTSAGFEQCDFRESFAGPCRMNMNADKTAVYFFNGTPAPPPPPPPPLPTDTEAPQTTITDAPGKPVRLKQGKSKAKVTLGFDSSEAGSRFECKLDGGSYQPCSSPQTYKLRKGSHTLSVRATDPAGNTDASPATVKVKVKPPKK